MTEIPHAVLSEALSERIADRRVVSAIFVTYKFEPAFFEQEILPVLLNVPLSHATAIRLLQLEDSLRSLPGEVAVYYDAKGLISTGTDSAKLDVRRIPILHSTGIFHPKNVFLLLESGSVAHEGPPQRALLVASLSANLTRAGWWENVEVCHFEEITEGDKTGLKDDLIEFLETLRRRARAGDTANSAISDVLSFLQKQAQQRMLRSAGALLHTRFYAGTESLVEFLNTAAGDRLRGANLEIISPYFDDDDHCAPLEALIERFEPKEVRVSLPRGQAVEALCAQGLFESLRNLAQVSWAKLPIERSRAGKSADLVDRFVHAKVYRFFHRNPAQEILFVGSANLTSSGHQIGGNVETGFLVELAATKNPDFWLEKDSRKPLVFEPANEANALGEIAPPPLVFRYHWGEHTAAVFWLEGSDAPRIQLSARGLPIGSIEHLRPRTWTSLAKGAIDRMREILEETSFVQVTAEDSEPAIVLVQEEGMAYKPSLLLRLSVADILRYWAMLTPAQRNAFIEAKSSLDRMVGDGADLITPLQLKHANNTLFDRFAGFFHAFGALRRHVDEAIEEKRTKDAFYRLFGNKYDSLSTLLGQLSSVHDERDNVDRYVIVLCATQLLKQLKSQFPGFWDENAQQAKALEREIAGLSKTIRQSLIAETSSSMKEFLEWFDKWFLELAQPAGVQSD